MHCFCVSISKQNQVLEFIGGGGRKRNSPRFFTFCSVWVWVAWSGSGGSWTRQQPPKINWRSKRFEIVAIVRTADWRVRTECFEIETLKVSSLFHDIHCGQALYFTSKGHKVRCTGNSKLIEVALGGFRSIIGGVGRKINSCEEWFVMISL